MKKRPIACCGASCLLGSFAGLWVYQHFGSILILKYHLYVFYFLIFIFSFFIFSFFQNIPWLCYQIGQSRTVLFFLVPCCFLLCMVRFCVHMMPTALEQAAEELPKGQIRGTVMDVIHASKTNKIYLKDVVFLDSVSGMQIQDSEGILLLYDTSGTKVLPEDVITAGVTLKLFEKASNQGQYNEYIYQKIRGRTAFAYSKKITLLGKKAPSVQTWLYLCRQKLSAVFDCILPEQTAALIKAMLLGDKTGIPKQIKELYSQNGIAHILAISGLHISMIGMIVYRCLRWLLLFICLHTSFDEQSMIKRKAFFVQMIPIGGAFLFLWLYANMVGMAVSVQRAVMMFLLSLWAVPAGRTYDMITGISLSVSVILLQQPCYLLDSGFWLSFGAVFGIAVLFPLMNTIEKNTCKEERKEKQKIKQIEKRCKEGLLVSVSVFLMTFPVVIKTYASYPFYGIFLNLLVLPLMSVLMPAALLAGVIGLFCPQAASCLGVLIECVLYIYQILCLGTQKLPFAMQLTGCPSLWKIGYYYLLLFLFMFFLYQRSKQDRSHRKQLKKYSQKITERICLCLFFCVSIGSMYRLPSSDCRIHILDVGQGDALVLELPHKKTVTIDGGSSDLSAVGEYRVLPFLKSQRIKTITCAFLTHMDEDHINGIQELLENGEVLIERLVVPFVCREKELWKTLEQEALQQGTQIFYMKAGDNVTIAGVRFFCIHPSVDFADTSENAASLVLKMVYGEFEALFTGDVEGRGEAAICTEEIKDIDLLKVSHHGSKNSSTEEFIKLCSPVISVISCGKNNRYGHPHEEVLTRLQQANSHIFVTKDSGEITIFTDGKRMKIKTYQ